MKLRKRRPPAAVHNPPPMKATQRPLFASDFVYLLFLVPPLDDPSQSMATAEDLAGVYTTRELAQEAERRFPAPHSWAIANIPVNVDMFANVKMTRVPDVTEGEERS